MKVFPIEADHQTATGRHTVSYPTLVLITLIIGILKLILVANNEIVALPHDSWAYVATAGGSAWYANGGVSPGYPLWLGMTAALGIPARIAIEVLLVSSAAVFAFATGYLPFRYLGYTLILTSTVFTPATYFLFDFALADGFYLCLTLLSAGLTIISVVSHNSWARWVSLSLLGCTLGITGITRKEGPLLLAALLILAVSSLLSVKARQGCSLLQSAWITLPRLLCVVVITFCIMTSVSLIHWLRDGVWARSLTEMTDHTRLLSNLAAIKTKSAAQRFIPISKEARQLAYSCSPSLQRLKPVIEDPNNMYQQVSAAALGRPGEIGAGWIWHLFTAAVSQGANTPRKIQACYRQINLELEDAFKSGKLSRQFVLQPLLGADQMVWLPHLGSSFRNVLTAMEHAYVYKPDGNFDAVLFDMVCMRRASLIQNHQQVFVGWAFAEPSQINRVMFEGTVGTSSEKFMVQAGTHVRQDVMENFRRQGIAVPADNGFSARVHADADTAVHLRFYLQDGGIVSADATETGVVKTAKTPDKKNNITYALDSIRSPVTSTVAHRLQLSLVKAYKHRNFWMVVYLLSVISGIVALLHAIHGGADRVTDSIPVFVLICWLLPRLAFYTILDAAAWSVESRYLQISGVLFCSLAMLGCLMIGKQTAQTASRRAAP